MPIWRRSKARDYRNDLEAAAGANNLADDAGL
jgi:hypothetical protein